MQRFLLLNVLVLAFVTVWAQTNAPNLSSQNGWLPLPATNPITDNETGNALHPAPALLPNSSARSTVGTQIGNTTYDLQTNYGMCRRVFVEETGTVHATWTRSTSGDVTAPDRGTGYNVSADNGDTWGATPTVRIEGAVRTGWPNVGVTASGRIFAISHATGQGLHFCYKDPGASGWTNRSIGTELGDVNSFWARAANDGNKIHVVISSQESTAINANRSLHYFRSLDGGDTWEGPFDLPQLDQLYDSITADTYFIDVKDNVVALVIGWYATPLVLYKSVDDGNTWTRTFIYNPLTTTYIGNNPACNSVNTLVEQNKYGVSAAGGIAAVIDPTGMVHVWFDRLFYYIIANSDTGPFYMPANAGIMYWCETMSSPRLIGETVRQDYDQDGTTALVSPSGLGVAVCSYGVSIVGQPSAGIDAAGNLYVAYSAMVDGAYEVPSSSADRLHRDVYLIKSTDGGNTWIGPLNVTNSPDEEDVFPAIGRLVNDKVHLVWQNDDFPGLVDYTDVSGTGNCAGNHSLPSNNGIYYIGIPVEEIVTPSPLVNTKPQIYYQDIPNGIQNCQLTIDRFNAHALDYPDGDISDNLIIGGNIDVTTPANEAYTLTLSVTDSDGNETVKQFLNSSGMPVLVSVYEDNTAPLVAGNPAWFTTTFDNTPELLYDMFAYYDTIHIPVGSVYTDWGVVTWDNSQDLFGCAVTVNVENSVNTAVAGVYTIQYTATDVAGNSSEPLVRTVIVENVDTTPPTITLYDAAGNVLPNNAEITVEVEMGGVWQNPDFMAFDTTDGIICSLTVSGSVNMEEIGSYTINYTATDADGNTATATLVVQVVDTTPPVINLIGPSTVTVPCFSLVNFTDPTATLSGASVGYTAFDSVDGNLTYSVVVNLGGFCSSCSGTYTITYNVTDAAGNVAIQLTRTVIVLDGCAETWCYFPCASSINNPDLSANINLYPNPSRGTVNVAIVNIDGKAEVKVYNPAGKLLQTASTQTGELTLDLSQYAAGMYFVEVTTPQGMVTKSVVVEK